MRFLLIIIIYLFNFLNPVFGCVCNPFEEESISARVKKYDFIAHVKIRFVKVYSFENRSPTGTDFALIEILRLFKGNNVDSIYVSGIGTSCDMGMRAEQEWVIYGNLKDNYYQTHLCTPSSRIEKYNTGPYSEKYPSEPFFLTPLYLLNQFFKHPLPFLENGIHEDYFLDKRFKSYYLVIDHKIEGSYYFSSKSITYLYLFKNGVLDGISYIIFPDYFYEYIYNNGRLLKFTQYNSKTFLSKYVDHSAHKLTDSFFLINKSKRYEINYLEDGSKLKKNWYQSGRIKNIHHHNSTSSFFKIEYFESGEIETSQTYDEKTRISYFTRYNANGSPERKIIWYPDKTREATYYNQDGSVKKIETRQ